MHKTAIILGATGLVGRTLLQLLIEDDRYTTVKIFGRSSTTITHPKVAEYLGDLFNLATFSEVFTGDVVFCCIGTTKAKTPDKETYKKIDHGIPLSAAILAKQNNIKQFQVISAMGANENSSTFYNKVKGEMERDVLAQGIQDTIILQPSLIGGNRAEKRLGEQLAQKTMRWFDFLVPKRYKIIEPETIAKAMIIIADKGYKTQRVASDQIKEIVGL